MARLFILYPAIHYGKNVGYLIYFIDDNRFVILSKAKDRLFMLTLPANLPFSINPLLSAQNTR